MWRPAQQRLQKSRTIRVGRHITDCATEEHCTDVIAQNTAMMERLEKALGDRFECPLRHKCPEG